ncbi:SIMPL domain-containing protein [Nocardioides sp.]|uniref:SIMPL domain-containing protein n=1 Tax=Nocardioides sp. TaxID=35761 RepID=UPI003D101F70
MTRTVSVTGRGHVRVIPDSAVVRVAAAHRAASVGEAFAGVGSAVAAITETARGEVEESRIGSSDLSVWPVTDQDNHPDGFECRHALEIRCPSLDVAGALLEALVGAVGDRLQVEGVSLEVTDKGAAQVQARAAAYADSVARATELATLSGARLGQVLSLAEGDSHSGGVRAFAASAKADFQPGERALALSLDVTFELLDLSS